MWSYPHLTLSQEQQQQQNKNPLENSYKKFCLWDLLWGFRDSRLGFYWMVLTFL